MKVFPIEQPLQGEQLVSVKPPLQNLTAADAARQQRINYFSGRNLTHSALNNEQQARSDRIGALGKILSSGVIDGLSAELQVNSADTSSRHWLQISSGQGVAGNGELVTLNRPLQLDLQQIPVLDMAAEIDAETMTILADLKVDSSVPRVMILLLQAVSIEMNLQAQADPCELDPAQYAYENWQLVDGVRLLLYPWPEDVITLPGQSGDAGWRNQLAHSVFDYERLLGQDESLVWMEQGVALALIGFDQNWQPQFIDRDAVRRAGGQRRTPRPLLPNQGDTFLWQAQFEQFNQHLVDILQTLDTQQDVVSGAASQLRYLPPVGVLPLDFVDIMARRQHFFPLSYRVELLVAPYEQLDYVMAQSAPLASYDFNRADHIQLIAPVPQQYFDTDLLETAQLDLLFDDSIEDFVDERNQLLGNRLELRRKLTLLSRSISGRPLAFPEVDPQATDNRELAAPFENARIEHGDFWRFSGTQNAPPADWFAVDFDDSNWQQGATPFGYRRSDIETELDDMAGHYVTILGRVAFNLQTLDTRRHYRLEVITNGGFVAYLNGAELQRYNLENSAFDAPAGKVPRELVQIFELNDFTRPLHQGENMLAIQAHAPALDATGFVFSLRLIEVQYSGQLEDEDYGIAVVNDEQGEVVLSAGEPIYRIDVLESLKDYFNHQTYQGSAADGKLIRIWASDDIEQFEAIENNGLQTFIEFLEARINHANDKVDFGFIRLQTDIYRIRQFVLGNEQATKLATSPVLAGIAKGETAVATRTQISAIAASLKLNPNPQIADDNSSGNAPATSNADVHPAGEVRTVFGMNGMRLNRELFLSDGLSSGINVGERVPTQPLHNDLSGKPTAGDILLTRGSIKKILDQQSQDSGLMLALQQQATPEEVVEQGFIIGSYPIFRNVTVGERLQQPVTDQAVDSGRATRVETINNIKSSGLSMDGISIPGFKDDEGNATTMSFGAIDDAVLGKILQGQYDPVDSADEASRFSIGVNALENAAALLRLTEGRVKAYRLLANRCRLALKQMKTTQSRIDRRLKPLADALAEARHDVVVARALKAEEQQRIDAINQRRQNILQQHTPFLLFRRPRAGNLLKAMPTLALQPDVATIPLPDCDVRDDEMVQEIGAMMDAIREAPMRWFLFADQLLDQINHPADLQGLMRSARARAKYRNSRHRLISQRYEGLNLLAKGINQTLASFSRVIEKQRQQLAAIDLAAFYRYGWQQGRQQARRVISLGDLIDGNHGRIAASKQAAQELEQISRAAQCLYHQFSRVLPVIRMGWAEILSQYDAAFKLRNLYNLPRWDEIGFIERKQMQSLVDGLYGRIDSTLDEAVGMVNELVRICILLASHAPVNQLISALVAEPQTIRPGSVIDVLADLSRVHIGMKLTLSAGQNTLAYGRVSDIVGGRIKGEITHTLQATVLVEQHTRVQISDATDDAGWTPQAMAGFGLER